MKKFNIKYISTRLIARKSNKAFQEGAEKAMATNGYVVVFEDGCIVRKYANGTKEVLEVLNTQNKELKVVLD